MSLEKGGRRNRILINMTLLTLSLSLSVVIAEMALHAIFVSDSGTSLQYRIPHPVFGWVLEPNASYTNRLPEAAVPVTYNSRGWRDVEHQVENPDDVFRILLLGDSFMEAYSVALEESFPRQLEALVRASGIDVEVINLGVGGYGTLQEYLTFQDVGRRYEPDLVLLGFTIANDVKNNSLKLEMMATDLFKISSRPFLHPDTTEDWTSARVDLAGAQQRYAVAKAYQRTLRYKLKQRSFLLRFVTDSEIAEDVRAFFRGGKARRSGQPKPIDEDQYQLAVRSISYCNEPAEVTEAWDITARIVAQLKQDVEATDSELVVFTVPARWEVVDPNTEKPTSDLLCVEEAPGYTRLTHILADLKIDQIDLLPKFRSVSREDGVTLYRHSDRHWNPAGHLLASERVASALFKMNTFQYPRE